MPTPLQVWTLTLREISRTSKAGPHYAHWVDAQGKRSFCFLGIGGVGVAKRYPQLKLNDTWEVTGHPMESGTEEACFDLNELVRVVRTDPMRRPQSAAPVFLPPAVRTANNTLPV